MYVATWYVLYTCSSSTSTFESPPPPPGSCGSLQWVTPASDAQLLNYQVFFQSICKPFVFIAASKIYLNM